MLCVCPQGERMVVERFGRLHSIKESGWFVAIPMVDKIQYRIDMREQALEIQQIGAITRDNVSVKVSGNVYVQFVDAEKAAYGSQNPLYAVKQHAQACMRAAIGEMELDQILHARSTMNTMIRSSVQGAAENWGLDVKRYEITEIVPDRRVAEAMDRQAAAERERRERVLQAEGEKTAATLRSEGEKIKLTNESLGNQIRTVNEAEASRDRITLEAEGQAVAIARLAQAHAQAISTLAVALKQDGGAAAAQLQVAREYIDMYGRMAENSNTMIFSDRPGDVNALLAQAAAVVKSASGDGKSGASSSPGHSSAQ